MTLYLELLPVPSGSADLLGELTALARTAEDAGFDAFGFPLPAPGGWPLEPTTVLPALAVRTACIALITDVSPSYAAPYNVARYVATLDHVSRGRAGWRLVAADPAGFTELHGADAPEPARRRARADEYADLLPRLWDSWDDDAIPADREHGVYVDEAKIRETRWAGAEFRVQGPLNVPRSPQGHPVLTVEVAAGDPGSLDLAARHADIALLPVDGAPALLTGLRAAGREPLPVLAVDELPADPATAATRLAELAAAGSAGFRLALDQAGLDRVARHVLPALAELGHPRPAPGAGTFRDRLGLARPADRSAEGAVSAA